MILATNEQTVAGFIEFELIKLAERINVGGNLTPGQIEFIATQLVGMYPNETIADFKICFEKGAAGAYGKIFKLDGIEVGQWVKAYLEEKYQVIENELMKEKEAFKNNLMWRAEAVPDERAKQYLKDWEHRVLDSKIETSAKPSPSRRGTGYRDPHTAEWYFLKDRIKQEAATFYKDRYRFDKMKYWPVGEHEVFAESIEDAERIYLLATKK